MREDLLLRRARAAPAPHARHRARRGERGRDGGPARPDVAGGGGRAGDGQVAEPARAGHGDRIGAWSAGTRAGWTRTATGSSTIRARRRSGRSGSRSPAPRSAVASARSVRGARDAASPFRGRRAGCPGAGTSNSKDLRALLGRRVRGRFGVSYCGRGDLAGCERDLWAAMNEGGASGGEPARGTPCVDAAPVKIAFSAAAARDMQ